MGGWHRIKPGGGIMVRKTLDLLIGTCCIENRRPLLHNDSDFQPMRGIWG